MKLIVDRIVENIAVLEKEDMSHIEIDVFSLPEGTKEGSVIVYENGAYSLDCTAEEERKKQIAAKQRTIFGNL